MTFKDAQHFRGTAPTSSLINLSIASDNETVQAILDRLFTTGYQNAEPVIVPNAAMAAPPRRRVEITDFYPTSGTGIELTVLGRTALEFEDARFDAEMRVQVLEVEKLRLECTIDKLNEQIVAKDQQIAEKNLRLNHGYHIMTRMNAQLDELRASLQRVSNQLREKQRRYILRQRELTIQVTKNNGLTREREQLQSEQDSALKTITELQAQNTLLKRELEVSKGKDKSIKKQVKYLVKRLKDQLTLV
ncbi:hypothetical protein NpPPO83_00010967 [Neofusicoccum parvum]|uniref:Uncharacterized protein n=1 Tax=Neofusicoccum parvum TaxID=310453 RepID=A0ACB5SFN5_9PEZI|nr:hypothetical protein NpPPO83_00010967 [Neofusicoccum parvum]